MTDQLAGMRMDWTAEDWRLYGQAVLDLAIDASTHWPDRRPSPLADPAEVRGRFADSIPESPQDIATLIDRLRQDVFPLSAFNNHPRWLAYITGSGLPISVLADLFASAINQNVGLWRIGPAATAIELQTVRWINDMVGYPSDAEGVFVSGGQMANIVAHNVARDAKVPWDVRKSGIGGFGGRPQLRIYASDQVHYCHQEAAELLGLGREAVRTVPSDEHYRIRLDVLSDMIAEDRARGDLPLTVVGNAGTVTTGAIDPLDELADLAAAENLWFHVDGAYGAFAVIADGHPLALDAIARADSIACDPHKWLYAPIDAGVTLVRQQGSLARSFSFHPTYLATDDAAGRVDFHERTPENSRPFRALKVWLALQAYGRSGFAAMIERNIRLAAYMERLVREIPGLVLAAPRELSITCWRVEPLDQSDPERLERLQHEVIEELERRGVAVVSNAPLKDGRTAIRACIVNFRTTEADVEIIVETSAVIGAELASRVGS